ncbi:hypothetical protein DYI21_17215 [Thalassospira tepidiphila]|jgi:hypothetical protein|nr:hypothetical protein [Thalassospira tepidiphila]HAI30575.1 hypothetical protein [Thalassospira sp.]HCK17716.1 hypothetical protein [Thalassospira sp.]
MTSLKRKLKLVAVIGGLLSLSGCLTPEVVNSPEFQKLLQTEEGRAQLAKFIEQNPHYITTMQPMLFGTGS